MDQPLEFLDDPEIIDALKRALDRGVKVKIYVGGIKRRNKNMEAIADVQDITDEQAKESDKWLEKLAVIKQQCGKFLRIRIVNGLRRNKWL